MKAVIYTRYGHPSVLSLAEVADPRPAPNEILVRVRATTVSSGDWRARSLAMPAGFGLLGRLAFGLFGPRKPILGTELAGEVVDVGDAVTRFKPGDEVFAFTGAGFGCHAQFRTVEEHGLIAMKPPGLPFGEAAALSFGALTALRYFRHAGGLQRGQSVLVIGASGAVGMAAIQIAKHFGADVTGVCSSANLDIVRSIGADRTADYTKLSLPEIGGAYDIILDTTGTASFARCECLLKGNGRLLLVQPSFAQAIGFGVPARGRRRVVSHAPPAQSADIGLLAELAQAGALKPFVDRRFPLAGAQDAHAYVDTGRKRGCVVLDVD